MLTVGGKGERSGAAEPAEPAADGGGVGKVMRGVAVVRPPAVFRVRTE